MKLADEIVPSNEQNDCLSLDVERNTSIANTAPHTTDHAVVDVNVPAENEVSAATGSNKRRKRVKKRTESQKLILSIVLIQSIILLPFTLGIILYSPSIIFGHLILRYAIPCSFGDAYRTVWICSSAIVGVAAGTVFGVILLSIMGVARGVRIYRRFRPGRSPSSSNSASLASKLKLRFKNDKGLLTLFARSALAALAGCSGVYLLHYIHYDIEVLDTIHAAIASGFGHFLITAISLLVERRSKGKVALATPDAPEITNEVAKDIADNV